MADKTILETAAKIVDGARNEDYGDPADNHRACARLWEVWKDERGAALTEVDVCVLMILLKLSRTIHGRWTRDTLVDIAGYARNIELLLGDEL